ncbi:hypothetical protein FIBSPDRAFT_967792, partial [Athelia psychrophila]
MGHEPLTKYVVAGVVALQLNAAYLLRHTSPLSWQFIFAAYAIGRAANQNLFMAIHQITHNLTFRGIAANKLLAICSNLPSAAVQRDVQEVPHRAPQAHGRGQHRHGYPDAARAALLEQCAWEGVLCVRSSAYSPAS